MVCLYKTFLVKNSFLSSFSSKYWLIYSHRNLDSIMPHSFLPLANFSVLSWNSWHLSYLFMSFLLLFEKLNLILFTPLKSMIYWCCSSYQHAVIVKEMLLCYILCLNKWNEASPNGFSVYIMCLGSYFYSSTETKLVVDTSRGERLRVNVSTF